jgi:hypothetical protein
VAQASTAAKIGSNLAPATVNLVVIKRLFWNEIAHDVRMTPMFANIHSRRTIL